MKKIDVLVAVAAVLWLANGAYAAVGDTWNLRDDFSAVNNPNTVGDGMWEYMRNYNTPLTQIAGSFNGELPTVAAGWTNPGEANHMVVAQYGSADGPNTTFNRDAGSPGNEVGGHGPFGVAFYSVNGGTYEVRAMAYNARLAHPPDRGLGLAFNGVSNGGWIGDINTPIDPILNSGYDNGAMSLAGVRTIELLPNPLGLEGGAGDYVIIEIQGEDWAGLDIWITEIPEPSSVLLLAVGALCIAIFGWRRRR